MAAPVIVYGLDPGTAQSALVLLADGRVIEHRTEPNAEILASLRRLTAATTIPWSATTGRVLVIEQIESMGMAVGQEVFETVWWSGRFAEAFHPQPVSRVTRRQVKLHLCGSMQAKDTHVRQAILDRYGPGKATAVGRKATPGPLYGLVGHEYAALAVALTWVDAQPAAR